MKKLLTGFFVLCGLILLLALGFVFYGQFALDYSLENLREALIVSAENKTQDATDLGNHVVNVGLGGAILDEISHKNADLESVVLLEHASRSIREAIQQSGYTQAGVYLAEVLKDRTPRRGLPLQITDAVYHFLKNLFASLQDLSIYILSKIHKAPAPDPLAQTGVLILAEAEKKEKAWKLDEAEGYYREFLDRYPDRPERGFVKISLAYVMTKLRKLDEAKEILISIKKEFPGSRESALASSLIERITSIQKRLNRIPELENWVKSSPDRFFKEEGGLELALSYLATYQFDQAQKVLLKLTEAPDPRIRTKAIFYRGWIYKWQGDLDQGKAFFEMLQKEPVVDEELSTVAAVQIAEVHYEKKEFKEAFAAYEQISAKAAGEAWHALSELEKVNISIFGLGDIKTAQDQLQQLKQIFPSGSADLEVIRKQFEEALEKGIRNEAFRFLAQGKVEAALKRLDDYLKKYPRDGTAQSGRASILLIRGELDEALRQAQRGFELTRSHYTATTLGYVYEKMQKLEKAIEYYQIALEIKPTYVTAQFNLAWIFVRLGRFAQADKLLEQLEKDSSDLTEITQAKILNNRGCALWGLGRQEEATAHFQQALKIVPDFNEAIKNANLSAGERPTPAVI